MATVNHDRLRVLGRLDENRRVGLAGPGLDLPREPVDRFGLVRCRPGLLIIGVDTVERDVDRAYPMQPLDPAERTERKLLLHQREHVLWIYRVRVAVVAGAASLADIMDDIGVGFR